MNKETNNKVPELVGLKEFADLLGWDKPKLSIKFSRQKSGMKVKKPLPDPVQILAATPIWTLEQARAYKNLINEGAEEMPLKFTYDEISARYEKFVQHFMSAESGVKRTKLAPHFWIVSVPKKDFKVAITCEKIGHFHGIEQWFAVVEEPNGEKSNFLLFEEEIEQWASEQRKLRGIE